MFRVGIRPLHRLLGLHVHVGLLVPFVVEHHAAIAGVRGLEAQMLRLPAQDTPHVALPVIAGDGHADAGGVPLRQGLQYHVVTHIRFLSQPFHGCLQEPQPSGGVFRQSGQLQLPQPEIPGQDLRVVVLLQDVRDGRQAEAHLPQGGDASRRGQLALAVVAVAGEGVRAGRHQQTDLIVVPQHPDTHPGQLGKISDLQHVSFLRRPVFLSSGTG